MLSKLISFHIYIISIVSVFLKRKQRWRILHSERSSKAYFCSLSCWYCLQSQWWNPEDMWYSLSGHQDSGRFPWGSHHRSLWCYWRNSQVHTWLNKKKWIALKITICVCERERERDREREREKERKKVHLCSEIKHTTISIHYCLATGTAIGGVYREWVQVRSSIRNCNLQWQEKAHNLRTL